MYIHIYIYIYIFNCDTPRHIRRQLFSMTYRVCQPRHRQRRRHRRKHMHVCTPNLPTNIVPTNVARVKLSGKIPRKSLWAWEFHPFKFRLCSSRTLRNQQC